MTPVSIELFAGGGGMALSMHAAGFDHLALVEWDRRTVAVLERNAELSPQRWRPDSI